MKTNIKFVLIFLVFCALFVSCSKPKSNKSSLTPPEVKKGVAPVADNEVAVIELENSAAYGKIKIELYSNIAPKMVARFKELAREGFYNGTAFHRIDPNLGIIQGGDPNSKDDDPANDGMGNSTKPNVEAELSDLPYEVGTVGAARTQDFNSANSQFYVTLKRQPAFDAKYTVFGKVIEGLNSANTIAGAPKQGDKPLDPVKIKSVTFETR